MASTSNNSDTIHKEKEKDWYQIAITFISSLTALACGVFFGWPSPSIPVLISPEGGYNFTLEECSYFTVISAVTTMLTSVAPGVLLDRIGRKYSLLFLAAIQISICLLYAFSKHIYLFYVARVLTGIGDAASYAMLPVYLGEMLTPKVRGSWGNVMSIQINLGQFLVNAIGGYLSIRTTALITLTIPITFLCFFPYLPESPYYYSMKGKREEAKSVLRKLRRVQNVDEEFKEIEEAVQRQLSESGTWKSLFTVTSNRKAVLAAIIMRNAQQASGFSAFSSYTKYIFQQTTGVISASDSSTLFNAVLPICCVLGAYLMDKLGRRVALVYSITGMALMCVGESIYFYIEMYLPGIDLEGARFIPLMLMMVYAFIWCTGLGLVPNLMLGELFSAGIKGKALAVANIANGLSVSLSTKIFQVLEVNVGLWFPFAFFAACSVVCLWFVYFYVPETKRKTLEQIQISLQGHKKSEKKNSV